MNDFVLIAGHRSGTTMLLRSLESHPRIECHKRPLKVDSYKGVIAVDNRRCPYRRFRTASLTRRFDYLFNRQRLVADFVSSLSANAGDNVQAVGIRITYLAADKHPEILGWAIENEVPVVHLIRENALKTILSRLAVKARGIAHSTQQVKAVKLTLEPASLKKRLQKLTEKISEYQMRLGNAHCLEMSYESFVAERDPETRRLLNFLGIDDYLPLTSNTVKLNPDSLEDVIENYAEVKTALEGTDFERFLH